MKKAIFLAASLSLLAWLLTACGAPATAPEPQGKVTAAPAPRSAGQQKWDKVLSDAKKEGEVLVYSNINPALRSSLSNAFREKYGIDMSFLALSRGSEVFARAASEKRAGINVADLFITGSTTLAIEMKGENLLGALEPLIFLPEVLDGKAWQGGQLAFTDKDKKVFDLIGAIWGAYVRNADLIKEGEITSFLDVLKPAYKGKIVMSDPTVPGSSNAFVTHLAQNLYGPEKAVDFLRQLMKQEPVITRDLRLQTEWVARGRYALAIGPDSKETASFIDVGAPLELVWPKEGAYTSSVGGSMGVPVQPPHSNATAAFINWLLTKEGLTLFSQGFGLPSSRLDVPVMANPKLLPPKDLKIFRATEEYIILQGKMLQTTREVMAAIARQN